MARIDWTREVVWRRGPLGTLHAQWRSDWLRGGTASCHSEDAGLAGAPEEYGPGACRQCVLLATALGSSRVERQHTEARAMSLRRQQLLLAAKRHPVNQAWAKRQYGISPTAARQLLRRAHEAGLLERLGSGEYVAAKETP